MASQAFDADASTASSGAAAELQRWPGHSAPEPPIRSELFGRARFEQHGHSLALTHAVSPDSRVGDRFYPRIEDNLAALARARALIEQHARDGMHLGPAAHWLLDNAALLDELAQSVRLGLSRNFFHRLPQLRDEPLAGLPRVYGVAWAWVAHADSAMDVPLLEAYFGAYQQSRELTQGELWALPGTLRVVLLENLRRLGERAALVQAARDAAHRWFDAATTDQGLEGLDELARRCGELGVAEHLVLQLYQRGPVGSGRLALALPAWIAERLPDPAGVLARQQAEATEDHQSIGNAITTLRTLDRIDWRALFAATNPAMRTLARVPVHAAEREDSQGATMQAVERLAREHRQAESAVAQALLGLCSTAREPELPQAAPAYWWHGPGLPGLHQALGLRPPRGGRRGSPGWRSGATLAYLGTLALLAALGAVALMHRLADPLAPAWLLALAALLLLGPLGEALVAVVNRLISESVRPSHLPRLALERGIPAEHRVMVVMPVFLSGPAEIAALCARLEQHRCANPEPQAQFALLSDWADAPCEHMPSDQPLLDEAVTAISALNASYPPAPGSPPQFLLLHRGRQWSPTEQRWIGWERKRGKLEQLVQWLAGGPRGFWPLGEIGQPAANTRYIVTLDADTDMPPGRLRELVGLAAHPLNQPRLDARGRRVVSGYGILQPRVESPLPAPGTVSPFHRLFAGLCGIDPYSAASSEIYQDLFGEGSFSGKGLLNVQAMNATLVNQLPEGQVLSHDLLEGAIARCAGVSDVTLLEDPPVHADVASARLHRWTRGDWQLLPLLWRSARMGLPWISRWKMLDNLRRSLVAPMSLALLVLVMATGVLPLGWTLALVAAAFGAGPLLGALAGLAPSRDDIALGRFYRHALGDLLRALALAAWHLAQLLQLAMMYGDAIARALYRQAVSRRHLLQWTTAAAAQAAASLELPVLLARHARVPLAAALLAGGLALHGALGAAPLALLLLWAASPLWTWLASRPGPPPRRARLDAESRHWLLGVARDTWRYFERHVGADDNHLPPDNVQHSPHQIVAHRTSPTNFGMYMLSAASAQALGFIGRAELAERLGATLDTLDRLPRHQGHFYNWYDTRTLAVLPPAYVSTVDSGNCCGHLLAVAQACLQLADAPVQAAAVGRALDASARRLRALRPVLQGSPAMRQLALLCDDAAPWPADASAAAVLRYRLRQARAELDALQLGQIGAGEANAIGSIWLLHDHLAMLDSALGDLLANPAELAEALRLCALRCRRLALAADFSRLYDPRRRLLHIGLRADSGQLDDNHYDLLASEARLTSLLAIAKGDVPVAHWAALGRPFFALGNEVGLKSWSGSMFEYLMPSLVLDEPVGSVLHQVTRSAVAVHRDEGRQRATPWGLSESAVAVQDHTLAYQYGPQGVARLALRRTPVDERVVAPYASAMAVLVAPVAAVANLRALQALGARQAFGFIEAIDYTPQRQREGQTCTPVDTFMAHHQGMSLVAFADLLCDGQPRRWAMHDPLLRAVAPLLHERAPREVPLLKDPPPLPASRRRSGRRMVHDSLPLDEALPVTQLLGNGQHAVVLRSHGGGHSLWRGFGITRWRDDLPRDDQGSWFYLKRGGNERWHSVTARPAPDERASYRSRLQADSVVFEAEWPDLRSACRVWVSPEDDCELREVTLCNTGGSSLQLTLASYAELTLAPLRADEAHPAFSNLFVTARWAAHEQALYLRRQPRLADEQPLHAVHFLVCDDAPLQEVMACADRAHWIGRHGSAAQPLGDGALLPLAAVGTGLPEGEVEPAEHPDDAGVAVDTGLDPIASIGARLRLAPGATIKLVFCTAVGREPAALPALVDKYRQASHRARSASMAHTMAGILLRELQLDADTWAALLPLNTLLTSLVHRELPSLPPPGHAPAARCDRRLLWRHGVSGDRPIVLVTIHREQGLGLVQTLARALQAWQLAGLAVDLVVVNAEPPSYLAPVQQQLQALRERTLRPASDPAPADQRGAMQVLASAAVDADLALTLQLLARVQLQADGRPLAQQVARLVEQARADQQQRRSGVARPVRSALGATDGGRTGRTTPPPGFSFEPGSGTLRFDVDARQHPSRPWVNVLANPQFGCQVSEMGSGFCWSGNSRLHQITGWSNDALRDPPAEWLLLHDHDSGRVWPLGRVLHGAGVRQVDHGIGFSRMQQIVDGVEVGLCWCVDERAALRQLQVRLTVRDGRPRHLRLVAMAEWTLGGSRAERLTLDTGVLDWAPAETGRAPTLPPPRALAATQLDHLGGFGGATAFLAWRPAQPGDVVDGPAGSLSAVQSALDDWTCDRREFHDGSGAPVLPQRLGQRSGSGLDACAALGLALALPAGGSAELTLLLGHGASPAAATALLASAWPVDPAQRLLRQRQRLDELLGGVQVHSPDPAFDALVNHWLPYQTLVCRLWARAGFYQAGGAFGFRDQLQDAMSLVQHAPALLAGQIRHNASRQFPEGDVQHWWHEPGGAGVRTHFSDDLLWLPLACALYLQRTGDAALLDDELPFLDGAQVPEGAEDVYETPRTSAQRATVYEHAARAIDHSLRTGVHGLPLFGSGDWNDGMNRVGHQGRGESVWLAWMLCMVVDGLLPIAQVRGDSARVVAWTTARAGWRTALERDGWDGRWYRRGFFDDGSALGSAANTECRIDLIAQAWAVLAGAGDPTRARTALASAMALLSDPPMQLLRLLDPPLQHASPAAGYIQAYPPGVRENGGQYNHAAAWALMALARLGEADAAWRVFTAMSPAHRWADATLARRYAIEPHVMAGDIYTQPPFTGRGGWSWYTGSAGWLLRAALESVCGVVVAQSLLTVTPALPGHWRELQLTLRHRGRSHRLVLCADPATARALLAREPVARRIERGQSVALDELADRSVLWLLTGNGATRDGGSTATRSHAAVPSAK